MDYPYLLKKDSDIGAVLRDLRMSQDLALKEVAARSGVSLSMVSYMEAGTRRGSLDTLLSILDSHEAALAVVSKSATQFITPQEWRLIHCLREERWREAFIALSMIKGMSK